MSEPNDPPESKADESLPTPQTQTVGGEVSVPRWVILVTFIIGWGAGGVMMGFEIAGQGRFQVMVLAAWLITLPLVASNPFKALRDIIGGQGRNGNGR